MADVQLENGYTQIANNILEALGRIRIAGEARQVLDVIIRKTYGFKKHEDRISLSQFCFSTGMSKTRVCQALIKLYKMHLITKKGNDLGSTYRFNKDFDTWKPLPKKEIITEKGNHHYRKRKSSLPKIGHTKETITKETITKEIKIFIDYAYQAFLSLKKEKLHIDGGKDGKTIKSLLGTYDIDKLKTLWDKFISSKDDFILKAGFSIGVFKSQVNKLTTIGGQNANKGTCGGDSSRFDNLTKHITD